MSEHQKLRQSSALNLSYIPITQIQPNPDNPRIHKVRQIKALAKSISSFGFNIPIVVDGNRKIIADHARFEAAKRLGMDQIPTISLEHLTAEQTKAFIIADSRLTELASWNDELLAVQLRELSILNLDFDLDATGFTMGEIDLRIESLDTPIEEDEEEEEAPLPQGSAVSTLGDLWQMGPHRLLCGSALEELSYKRLLEGREASMVMTDPPYNVKVDGHLGGKGKIKHREFAMASGEMSSDEFTQFLKTTFELLVKHSRAGSVHMIFIDWRHLTELTTSGSAVYSSLLNMCVWVKN